MKFKLLRFTLLSMLVMFFEGNVFADQITMKYSGTTTTNMTGNNDAALLGLDADVWSVVGAKGSNSNFPGLNKSGDFRLYYHKDGSNTITVSSLKDATINSISMTFNGSYSNVSVTVNGNAVEANDGSYVINSSSFVLGNANTSNIQVQIKEIVINYTAAASNKTATTVTLSEGYATSGIVGGTIDLPSATVKAGDATLNAAVTWTSSNEDVATISDGKINLLKAGTSTIKASYAGDDTNEASSASFTVTVTGVYTSLKALQEAVTSTSTPAQITFDNVVVTAVKGSNAYLADTDGYGALLYTNNHGLEAGQVLNGTITAKFVLYRGQTEITDFSKEGLTITTTTLTPSEKTIDKISAANQSTLVTLKDVKYADGKLTDGTNEITYYDTFSASVEFDAEKNYDVTGIIILYNSTIEISPRTADDVVEASTFRDFAVNLTNADAIPTTSNSFGVKVAEDGTYTATTADDATANFTVNAARFNDAQHGWVNCVFTVPVTGPVLIKLGDCQFGAQTGKITDSEGNVTELTKPAKQCWAASKPDENVVATYYRGLNATTLTVTYEGYCPFISVTAIDPADLPAEVIKHTVTFAAGEATGEVPAVIEDEEGAKITLPTNFTLYVEGKTLTAWSDGENTFAPGTEYTIPEADATLTAVFTENEVSLADRTEPVTLNFSFRRDQGAPIVQWQNTNGHIWVTQATVNGKTIDVPMTIDTNPGKFNNKNNTDCTQTNNGTVFTVPSCKGAEVTMECHGSFSISTTTIDGQTDYEGSGTTTIKQTIAGSAETIQIAIGDGSYYRYVKVVLPVVQSQGGKTYTNEAATIEWPMDEPANYNKSTATPDGAFSTVAVDLGAVRLMDQNGNENATGTSNVSSGVTFSQMRPTNNASDYVTWVVKPAAGLTFTPTKVTAYIVRFGTDAQSGVTISAKAGEGDAVTLGTFTAPRNNKSQADDKYGSNGDYAVNGFVEIELTEAQQTALTSGEGLSLMGTIGVGNTKAGGIAQVSVSGLINGTAADVAKYTLAVAAAPEDAGTVSKYPAADEYEAGTEVTLTATENFGYDFVNWTNAAGEEVSTEAKFKYTMNANETLTANFRAVETYELALTVDGTNDYMVTVNPAPTVVDGKNMYEAGTAVQLTANQYEGLVTFTNWSDGDTNSSKLIRMENRTEITAVYTQADIIAGWDFYKAGGNGRKADFAAADNDADALNLMNTESGETQGWLDKSTEAAGGYESFKGAAVNWRTGTQNGDVGNWHWQTKINAEAFTNITVQFQMLYNYNAYQKYNVEYSTNGENWTNFGSISMEGAKAPASFNETLPEAANNQKDLFIRMIADKTSNVDGAGSANDGNTLAMFFITGTPKLVDDPVAPALVSSVPADGATGASAMGKIVLNFDKKVQVVEGTKATLGALELIPAVSGKVITFEYKGLEYSTAYTFTLPANTVQNLTGATLTEPVTINFTTMSRPTVEKGLYDQVVSNVEELSAAIEAANKRADKSTRYRIFIKKGTYALPSGANKHYTHTNSTTGQVYFEGDRPDPITYVTGGKISFIGEDRDATIITQAAADETFAGQFGTTSIYDGIGNSDVLQLSGDEYYFQDLTIKSGIGDGKGRNLAIQDKGKKNIYKNVFLHGYQDTWTSNNDYGLYYFEGGIIRGRTDYICGKGDAYFNQVEFRQIAGGYCAVPSKPANIGWVMKDCVIDGDGSGVDGNYTLGRPWGNGTPVAVWIDTKMNVVPSAIGWNEMGTGWPKRFAEYNSTTSTGSVIDLSGRKKTFGDGHENNPVLTADEAMEYSDMSKMYGDWNPQLMTETAPMVTDVKLENNILSWTGNNYSLLYAICKNGEIIACTQETSFDLRTLQDEAGSRRSGDQADVYSVRAANEMGGLGEAAEAKVSTGIEEIANSQQPTANGQYYNMQGIRVEKARKGLYIINGKKVVIK